MRKLFIPLCLVASLVLAFGAGNAFAANQNNIGEEKAKSIALKDAGLSPTDISHIVCKLDRDDGVMEYDVTFWVKSTEYEYEINATTGEILGYSVEDESK